MSLALVTFGLLSFLLRIDHSYARRPANCGDVLDGTMVSGIEDQLADNRRPNLYQEAAKGKDLGKHYDNSNLSKHADTELFKKLVAGKKENGKGVDKDSNQALVAKMYNSTRLLHEALALKRKYGDLESHAAKRALHHLAAKYDIKKSDPRSHALHVFMENDGSYAEFSAAISKSIQHDRKRLEENAKALDNQYQNLKQRAELKRTNESNEESATNKRLAEMYEKAVQHTKDLADRADKLHKAVDDFASHKKRCKHRPKKEILERLHHEPPSDDPNNRRYHDGPNATVG